MTNSSTKCPICNTQNDPGATACQQCGFGFGLTQTMWPDYDLDDAPGLSGAPEPLDAPEPSDAPEPPDTPPQAEPSEAQAPPLAPRPSNDTLARAHIADGVRAMRSGSPGQAQLEFEQALDLTSDPAIARSAQKRLRELAGELDKAARLPVHLEAPPAQPAASLPGNLGWISALRLGLIIGFINSVLTGCGAIFCVGLISAPFFGFIAGWWVARQAKENERTSSAGHALLAGALVGLGGWFGQAIGNTLWFSTSSDVLSASELLAFACCVGSIYIAMTLALSALGWKLKTSRKS